MTACAGLLVGCGGETSESLSDLISSSNDTQVEASQTEETQTEETQTEETQTEETQTEETQTEETQTEETQTEETQTEETQTEETQTEETQTEETQTEETQTSAQHLLSEKRGLGYGHHSLNDLAALEGGINWWYNWYVEPDSQVANQYEDHNIEFVPMAWDENFDEPRLRAFLDTHPNVKYLLGFNEPNFAEQANLTPAEAAAQWPRVEAIADEYNLKIVGPAVNYSPGNVDIPNTDEDSDPWVYLDAFFAACEDCRVDYIAVHTYMKWDTAVDWFVGEFERYGKPIWVTEWAGWDEGGFSSVEGQMDYLAKTVRNMESNANVFRYAWFVGRTDGGANTFPYIDILGVTTHPVSTPTIIA